MVVGSGCSWLFVGLANSFLDSLTSGLRRPGVIFIVPRGRRGSPFFNGEGCSHLPRWQRLTLSTVATTDVVVGLTQPPPARPSEVAHEIGVLLREPRSWGRGVNPCSAIRDPVAASPIIVRMMSRHY